MSKKLLILTTAFALMISACQPASKRKASVAGETEVGKTDEKGNPDEFEITAEGKIVKRVQEPLVRMEFSRTENYPMSLRFTIELDDSVEAVKLQTPTYKLTVGTYGPKEETADETTFIKPGTKFYATLDAIFQGKQALTHKPIDPKILGAGTLSVRVTPAKSTKDRLIVQEPSVENGAATYFQEMITRVHAMMRSRAKKTAAVEEVVVNTHADPKACLGLNLSGAWKSVETSGDLIRESTRTLVSKKSTAGVDEYEGAVEVTEQTPFGDSKATKETATFAYDGKTCRLLESPSKRAFLVLSITRASALRAIQVQQCKDDSCSAVLPGAPEIEMRLQGSKI